MCLINVLNECRNHGEVFQVFNIYPEFTGEVQVCLAIAVSKSVGKMIINMYANLQGNRRKGCHLEIELKFSYAFLMGDKFCRR